MPQERSADPEPLDKASARPPNGGLFAVVIIFANGRAFPIKIYWQAG
jgi:hypothetical protein